MALRTVLDRVELAPGLDRLANPLQRGIQAVFRGRVRDFLHGVWLGHPIHPLAVQLPLGAWLSAAVLDTLGGFRRAATVLVGVGAAGAVPAATAGLNDWASLSREQRRVGLFHAAANTLALSLYTSSFLARRRGQHNRGRLLGFAGLAVVSTGGYIGGHLSYGGAAAVNQAEPQLHDISDGWHDLCAEGDVDESGPVLARIDDVPVLVSRNGGGVTVMVERCGHHTGPLSEGERVEIDGELCVVCPWHGSTFRLSDGAVMHGPAATRQPLLRSRIENGRVLAARP